GGPIVASVGAKFPVWPNAISSPLAICRTSYTPGPIGASIVSFSPASGKRLQLVHPLTISPLHTHKRIGPQSVQPPAGPHCPMIAVVTDHEPATATGETPQCRLGSAAGPHIRPDR